MKNDDKSKKIAEWAENQELPEMADLVGRVEDINLTVIQRKILLVKTLPDSHKWSVKKKCAIAKVSQRSWYRAMANAEFQRVCVEFVKSNVGEYIPEIWSQYVKGALAGNYIAMEKILSQCGVLEKDKQGDTVVNVAKIGRAHV